MIRRQVFPVLLVVAAMLPPVAQADEHDALDRYRFNVSASQPVENDWMTVRLSAVVDAKALEHGAAEVNETMGWAFDQLRGVSGVEFATEGYHSQPRYAQNQRDPIGWRVSQTLRLEGEDFDRVGELVGALQSRLAVQGMSFGLKPDTAESVEDDLIVEALAKLRRRAQLVAHQMGGRGYRVVEANMHNGGGHMPRPMMRMEMAADMAMAPPAVAGGDSEMTVSVDALIEVQD